MYIGWRERERKREKWGWGGGIYGLRCEVSRKRFNQWYGVYVVFRVCIVRIFYFILRRFEDEVLWILG